MIRTIKLHHFEIFLNFERNEVWNVRIYQEQKERINRERTIFYCQKGFLLFKNTLKAILNILACLLIINLILKPYSFYQCPYKQLLSVFLLGILTELIDRLSTFLFFHLSLNWSCYVYLIPHFFWFLQGRLKTRQGNLMIILKLQI